MKKRLSRKQVHKVVDDEAHLLKKEESHVVDGSLEEKLAEAHKCLGGAIESAKWGKKKMALNSVRRTLALLEIIAMHHGLPRRKRQHRRVAHTHHF